MSVTDFPRFAAEDPAQAYLQLLGFVALDDDHVHCFAAPVFAGEMVTLCRAYRHFLTEDRQRVLSTDDAAFTALPASEQCRDCGTQYDALRYSGIAAPVPLPPVEE